MFAAAQAAAEAAMLEAAQNDGSHNNNNNNNKQQQVSAAPFVQMSEESMPFDPFQQNISLDQEHLFMLHELAGMVPSTDGLAADPNQLLQLLTQQDGQFGFSASIESIPMRPQHHFLTISQNGTILESTNTVTGFPPDALLMTSMFENVHDDDLPGLLCVKSYFWDRNQPDVPAFVRRRTLDGDWLWLEAKAVTYISSPICGVTLQEVLVEDEAHARRINRITRIAAILIQAVEASWLARANADTRNEEKDDSTTETPALAEDSEAYQSILTAVSSAGMGTAGDGDTLQHLIRMATQSAMAGNDGKTSQEEKFEQELIENVKRGERKSFDPFSVIESVRVGVRLDLSMTRLKLAEVNLIGAVLSGKLLVNDAALIVLIALKTGESIGKVLDDYFAQSNNRAQLHRRDSSRDDSDYARTPSVSPKESPSLSAPPLSVLCLSYSYIGNAGVDLLSQVLCAQDSALTTIDISFCNLDEKGITAFAKALSRRKRKGIQPLKGIILSGNLITERAALEIGTALSPAARSDRKARKRTRITKTARTGYETDSNESEEDEEDDDDEYFNPGRSKSARKTERKESRRNSCCDLDRGVHVLHVSNASMTAGAVRQLMDGLGVHCPIRELNLSSNNFGPEGVSAFVGFLESNQRSKNHPPMPRLDRLDMSNNSLGDAGTTQLTRAISKRSQIHLVDLKLSSNSIAASGIETIMNKLLQHNLVSLSLDKNAIGDQGCQLVAASLQSMPSLAHLNLSFNQIGSRGINSLMRSLVACESITYLGLSGNILKISGAIALAYTLSQHPRLEELELDNCCLGQAAQCHIVAGIISNRWVPMKRLNGFAVGPPMVAIGALKQYASSMTNEECFRIRKDEQMKTMLQWMESNRLAKKLGQQVDSSQSDGNGSDFYDSRFLTPEFVADMNDVHGTPSQNAYFRMLRWLSLIPFDEDELNALQKYFYDADGGEGDRGSDGYINLKLRGDLLAALDSEVAEEIRDDVFSRVPDCIGSVGIDLDKLDADPEWNAWKAVKGEIADSPPKIDDPNATRKNGYYDCAVDTTKINDLLSDEKSKPSGLKASVSSSRLNMSHSESAATSASGKEKKVSKVKPRITLFPKFENQLEELKATATEMIEQEEDPMQHDIILTQYAEASLLILRQLRYLCMNSGFDGWRRGSLKRKVLIVDDSLVTRKLVSRAFEKANFIVDTAKNGEEGVEKLKASIYDIAFMDIDMPVMNGFEATKRLREWEDTQRPGARQPICALTATYVDDFERSELMKFKEAGLDVMESKPCNIPRLFKVVDDVSPMFSDLSISVIQREKSDSRLSDTSR